MKKISLGIIVLATFLTVISPAIALTPLRNEIRKTIRETVKEEKKEGSNPAGIKEDVKEIRMGLLDKVKNFMKKNLKFEARVKGKITVVGSNNFSLNGDDGTFQVNINDKTKFLRKFGGKSSLGEYSVGDEVIVFGKFTDDTKLIIDAKTVKTIYCGSLVAQVWLKAGILDLPEVKFLKIRGHSSFTLFKWSQINKSILGGLSWDNNRD